jgi:hypothetical protein
MTNYYSEQRIGQRSWHPFLHHYWFFVLKHPLPRSYQQQSDDWVATTPKDQSKATKKPSHRRIQKQEECLLREPF